MSYLEEQVEIANPQQPHCATVLLLDTSYSMSGDKIRQLNEGLQAFVDEVREDELARKRVDLAVVSFGSQVGVVQDFSSVEELALPMLEPDGPTPMGQALRLGIDMVERRKDEYRSQGTDYYRPWVFLVTDGYPTDMKPGDALWSEVVDRIHGGERDKKFLFFAVGAGDADLNLLNQLSPPSRKAIRLRENKWREMFQWLSRSQKSVSASRVGEMVKLEDPTSGDGGWGEISV